MFLKRVLGNQSRKCALHQVLEFLIEFIVAINYIDKKIFYFANMNYIHLTFLLVYASDSGLSKHIVHSLNDWYI